MQNACISKIFYSPDVVLLVLSTNTGLTLALFIFFLVFAPDF